MYLSYDKPCGKLALGQNCVKTISDKSNSVAMFLQIQTDIDVNACNSLLSFNFILSNKLNKRSESLFNSQSGALKHRDLSLL